MTAEKSSVMLVKLYLTYMIFGTVFHWRVLVCAATFLLVCWALFKGPVSLNATFYLWLSDIKKVISLWLLKVFKCTSFPGFPDFDKHLLVCMKILTDSANFIESH
jgi:hypothetical protein